MHFSKLYRVKEGKLDQIINWFKELSTARKNEAIATFEYEGVKREMFVLFAGNDGTHYVIGLNDSDGIPKPGNPNVPINQEHAKMKNECLEAISMPGEMLIDLHI
jgi:hypothetical protein